MQSDTRQAILNLLAKRDHSQQEIIQKLTAKGYPLEELQEIITDLIKTNLINDHRLTENYIQSRRNKGYGPKRIDLELQQRGIANEVIAAYLQINDNAWLVEAYKVWQKHFKNKAQDYKNKAKQMRFLMYRGFTTAHIARILEDDTG